ncbi:MAG: DUF1273 family protein [Clostridia bacterium]|nr:DUF1273 family protein [Clostridia bacterium]
MVVTFCGNRDFSHSNLERVEKEVRFEVERLINEGATEFLLGGYGLFDHLCARIVKELKEKYPHITSVLVVPYIDKDYDKKLYDYSIYPEIERAPKKFAIVKRNEYMVNRADVVITYLETTFGGAYKTSEYAKRKKKIIIDIFKG